MKKTCGLFLLKRGHVARRSIKIFAIQWQYLKVMKRVKKVEALSWIIKAQNNIMPRNQNFQVLLLRNTFFKNFFHNFAKFSFSNDRSAAEIAFCSNSIPVWMVHRPIVSQFLKIDGECQSNMFSQVIPHQVNLLNLTPF